MCTCMGNDDIILTSIFKESANFGPSKSKHSTKVTIATDSLKHLFLFLISDSTCAQKIKKNLRVRAYSRICL